MLKKFFDMLQKNIYRIDRGAETAVHQAWLFLKIWPLISLRKKILASNGVRVIPPPSFNINWKKNLLKKKPSSSPPRLWNGRSLRVMFSLLDLIGAPVVLRDFRSQSTHAAHINGYHMATDRAMTPCKVYWIKITMGKKIIPLNFPSLVIVVIKWSLVNTQAGATSRRPTSWQTVCANMRVTRGLTDSSQKA